MYLDDVCIVAPTAGGADYQEADGQRVMATGRNHRFASIWAAARRRPGVDLDLSYDYVRINAEYRT